MKLFRFLVSWITLPCVRIQNRARVRFCSLDVDETCVNSVFWSCPCCLESHGCCWCLVFFCLLLFSMCSTGASTCRSGPEEQRPALHQLHPGSSDGTGEPGILRSQGGSLPRAGGNQHEHGQWRRQRGAWKGEGGHHMAERLYYSILPITSPCFSECVDWFDLIF